jgi:DNA polymerase III subunit gamma/tau
LAATAVVCVVAAFGAAFLLTRAVDHPAPAHAGTISHQVATPTTPKTKPTPPNAELRSEFTPVNFTLRRKPHHRRPKLAPRPSVPQYTPPATSTQAAPAPAPAPSPAPTYTAPAYTAPQYTPPASSGSSGGTTHKKSSGSGSGTTTIGG